MKKMVGMAIFLTIFGISSVAAQSFGSVDNDKPETTIVVDDVKGFTAQVDIDTNLFQMTRTAFSDAKERYNRTDSFLIDNYPFGGFNILDDTNAAFAYNGAWYGGKVAVTKDGLGGIKAWVGFLNNKIKISAGNDIGYGYADSQGSDAGLRVYDDNVRNKKDEYPETIDSNKNPDNITQDKGILFEFDFDPLKLAFAGGGNVIDLAKNIGSVMTASNSPNYGAESVYGYSFQYGMNIGYKIGSIAKVNGAYVLQSLKDETKYEWDQRNDRIVATNPDAEMWTHMFGLYGSWYPFGDNSLGVTLGYAGVFIKYLEEFSRNNSTTNIPQILKNGLNLTARYKIGKVTIKTDHNYSFWSDKNYKIFYQYKPDRKHFEDFGLMGKENPDHNVSDITHSFLWNGIGGSYQFTNLIEGSLYIRNLLRTDETPELKMMRDYFSMELKSTFRFSPNVEAYMGIVYHYTAFTASQSLAELTEEFGPNNPGSDTIDSKHMFQIPIGFTLKLQK